MRIIKHIRAIQLLQLILGIVIMKTLNIFPSQVREYILKVATVKNSSPLIELRESSKGFICSKETNFYKIGDPSIGGNSFDVREDINADSVRYQVKWYKRGNLNKGVINLNLVDNSVSLSGDFNCEYLFD